MRRAELRERVGRVLALINLSDLADKTIPQLSGGQQQRVALARALIYEPSLMLFDEPFSNLDTQLRGQMRMELKALRRKVAMTGLFVTHDQVEALSVADQVAIMNAGAIEQVGAPQEVYRHPRTRFARDFLGRVVKLHGIWGGNGSARLRCGCRSGTALTVSTALPPGVAFGSTVDWRSVRNSSGCLARETPAGRTRSRQASRISLFTGGGSRRACGQPRPYSVRSAAARLAGASNPLWLPRRGFSPARHSDARAEDAVKEGPV